MTGREAQGTVVLVTADDTHTNLRYAWDRLRTQLQALRTHLAFGDAYLMEFADKADRAANLCLHLDAAVRLSDQDLYAPALAVVRTSLEHAVVDWLVFRGRTYAQSFGQVPDETWALWNEERAAGADWTRSIVKWERNRRGEVKIFHEGLYSQPDEDGNRTQLSIYYFLLEEYDGLVGPPSAQSDDPFVGREELRAIAAEQQAHWRTYLTWSALMTNLELNDLVDASDRGRLSVHYRFLSGFTHPVAHKQRELYGNNLDGGPPHYDHYASEIVLLYAIAIAALELTNFRDGITGRPGVQLTSSALLEEDLDLAAAAAGHFWFLGTNPDAWDLYTARNQVAFKLRREGSDADAPMPEPSEVPFSRDPLRRLVGQHATTAEIMTGYQYVSPWPRSDAWRR